MQTNSITLLPEIDRSFQQISKLKQFRLLCLYGLCMTVAIWLLATNNHAFWQAFASGLLFPGGAFLLHASLDNGYGLLHIFSFISILILFLLSIALWFATGNALAPPVLWLLSAILGATLHTQTLPIMDICGQPSLIYKVVALLTMLLLFVLSAKGYAFYSRKKSRRKTNDYLTRCSATFLDQINVQQKNEFSLKELKLMHFILDRALQPIEQFNGFEWHDQFQTAAVRYQLHFMGYALSMAQHTHLSAFSGYLNQAQENLIKKQQDFRIWKYWKLENSWGNFNRDSDPIKQDNIMFSGFCATQMAMYQATSDNQQNISFKLSDKNHKQFNYSLTSIVQTLSDNFKSADYYLMPCEPNWVYPLCNIITAAGIKLHNKALWSTHQMQFRQSLEHEFINASGDFIACKSTYTGFALPSIGGVMPLAMPCFFLNAILPDIALRQWLIVRRKILDVTNNRVSLNKKAFWKIDTGNYRFSRAASYAATALAAAEMGDIEIKQLCLNELELEYPAIYEQNGMYRPNASVWTHAVELLARSTTQNSFQSLINKPTTKKNTPIISHVPYPEVLVAHATYESGFLSTVLYLSNNQTGLYTITLSNLEPYKRYQHSQSKSFFADGDGNASIKIMIKDRTVLLICSCENAL